MNLAVITCAAYSDCWPGFFGLLEKFWPEHPSVDLLTDTLPDSFALPSYVLSVSASRVGASWCDVLRDYASIATESFCLMQEDFWLSAPVRTDAVKSAQYINSFECLGVRLYPCPGGRGDMRLINDDRFGIAGRDYLVSCQATIFNPKKLLELLNLIGSGDAAKFEIEGSKICRFPVTAWMRDVTPWPIEYICTAITRGKWNPDAKKLCDAHGIEVDWSRREMQAC